MRRRSLRFAMALMLGLGIHLFTSVASWADDCTSAHADGKAGDESFLLDLTCERQEEVPRKYGKHNVVSVGQPKQSWEHRWAATCNSDGYASHPDAADGCGIARTCPDGGGIIATHWVRELRLRNDEYVSTRSWQKVGQECVTFDPEDPPPQQVAERPQVTWQLVLREIKRMGLPALPVQVQPAEETLVNFETIFYAEPRPFEQELRLLGQTVNVRARATKFAWSFGDGATTQTTSAGAPYPSKEIVHKYTDAHVTVRPSVDVTYRAEFRVNGGRWQEIPETVTIDGPAEDLRIVEATPVLVG